MPKPSTFVDLLRLDSDDRASILDELDVDGLEPGRRRYRAVRVPLLTTHPGGGEAAFLVAARSLSGGAIEVLHRGFLHVGSLCSVWLRVEGGRSRQLEATVLDCRCVRGAIHLIALQFRAAIDPDEFLSPDDVEAHTDTRPLEDAAPPEAPPSVTAPILCIMADDDERSAVVVALASAGASVREAHCVGAGRDSLQRGRPDLIVTDLEIDDLTAAEVVQALRRTGYAGHIIGLSWLLDPDATHDHIDPSGATTCMVRPVTPEEVVLAARSCVDDGPARG